MGYGGIHTVDKPRDIIINNDEFLIDSDCASMYPRSIIERELYPEHLGPEWLEGYKHIYKERIKAKKEGRKSVNEAYKLALNGAGFGKTNEQSSWQYDPLVTFKVTINNQFALLMLCEQMLLNNIFVVSLNTDGILCIVKEHQIDLYSRLCGKWEELTKHTLESTRYTKFIQSSINDYIALTSENKVKSKGDFVIDKELHQNKSKRIRAIALKNYYIDNIPIKDTILNHQNIFDFYIGVKKNSNQTYEYFWGEEFILKSQIYNDKVVRYYISTDGGKLVKHQGNKDTKIDGDWRVNMYMIHEDKPIKEYNINYLYYETETLKITQLIKPFKLDEFMSKFKSSKQLQLL